MDVAWCGRPCGGHKLALPTASQYNAREWNPKGLAGSARTTGETAAVPRFHTFGGILRAGSKAQGMKMNSRMFPRVKRRNTTDTISKYARSLIPALPPSSCSVETTREGEHRTRPRRPPTKLVPSDLKSRLAPSLRAWPQALRSKGDWRLPAIALRCFPCMQRVFAREGLCSSPPSGAGVSKRFSAPP